MLPLLLPPPPQFLKDKVEEMSGLLFLQTSSIFFNEKTTSAFNKWHGKQRRGTYWSEHGWDPGETEYINGLGTDIMESLLSLGTKMVEQLH